MYWQSLFKQKIVLQKKCFRYNSTAANKGGGKWVCMDAYIQQVI